MSDDFTPSTEQVRSHYVFNQSDHWEAERGKAFDRWLAEHDRQVAERARVEFADELTRKGVYTFDIHSIRRAAKGEQK